MPGRKQVFRFEEGGRATHDVIARHDEPGAGRPLLEKVMEKGRRLPAGRRSWREARDHAAREIARLPERIVRLEPAHPPYRVESSESLLRYYERVAEDLAEGGQS